MPEEAGSRYQITIVCHLLALVHREHERIDRLLIDVAAPLVVKDQSLGRRILYLATILHARQLSDSLIDIAFIVDSVGFPEDKHWILAFVQLLISVLTKQIE